MALSKEKKAEVVSEVAELLAKSKLTVIAEYPGTTVKAMQALRAEATGSNTIIRIVKNRLIIKVIEANQDLKSVDTSAIKGQLLYAFNSDDEVSPAQVLANFTKVETQINFVGAITADGQMMSADDVKVLAALPGKEQLRAQLVGTIGAPLSSFVSVLSGNLRSFLNVVSARGDLIS